MEDNFKEGGELNTAALIIYEDFNIPIDGEEDLSCAYDNLKNILADRIQYLLVNDSEHLLRILYRIDVNSGKVENILSSDKFLEIPVQLAELVIERQLMKVRTREKYKNHGGIKNLDSHNDNNE